MRLARLRQEVPISQPYRLHIQWDFKSQLCGEIRVFAPRIIWNYSAGCIWWGGGASGRHKSLQEAAISVCFINPTEQFNSFVRGSSTSLINKSGDIIFSAPFEKPEMSSLLKEIILPVCDE